MSFPGIVSPNAFVAEGQALFGQGFIQPQRSIGGIIPDVTIEEEGVDRVVVTKHPVEQGANISDHAYIEGAEFTMRVGWSNSSPASGGDPNYIIDIYNQLLALKGQLVNVVTGKRNYTNVLLLSITLVTDETSPAANYISVTGYQPIIVSTTTTPTTPAAQQATPASTAAPTNVGSVSLNPVKQPPTSFFGPNG